MRRKMKGCECGKTNQSLDGSEPLPKDQAVNLPTHSPQKQRGKGKMYTMDIKWCEQKRNKKDWGTKPQSTSCFRKIVPTHF